MAAHWGSQTFSEARNSQAAKRSWHSPALSRQWLRRTSLSTMKRRPQRPHPKGDIQREPWRKEAVCQEHETGHGKMSEQHMDSKCWQGMISTSGWKPWVKKISSVLQHLCQSINGQNKTCALSLHKNSSQEMKVRWGLQESSNTRHWHPSFKKRRQERNWR